MPLLERRRFIHCLGGAGALVGIPSAFFLLMGRREQSTMRPISRQRSPRDDDSPSEAPHVASRAAHALGTTVSITAHHADLSQAERAIDAAFDELEQIEQLMSIYRPASQLSQLNRRGVLRAPDPRLVELLRVAETMSRRTDGAFDVTIQPLWSLYADAQRHGQLPSREAVRRALEQVGWQRVDTARDRIRLRGGGTQITLNGIAQGFAADRVMSILRAHGIERAMIDTGEIATLGTRTGRTGWTVGIQHPRAPDAYCSLVRLAGRCLATSGDYATSFTSDYRHHHLFDPGTGRSPLEVSSVSIAAPSATLADALSTAVFVLGRDRGLALVRQTPAADALLIDGQGRMFATAGFPIASI